MPRDRGRGRLDPEFMTLGLARHQPVERRVDRLSAAATAIKAAIAISIPVSISRR